jgi:hypothetical protein
VLGLEDHTDAPGREVLVEPVGRLSGVGCLYVALLLTTLAAGWFLVTGDLLSQNLQHPVGWPDYVTIARLASSIATVGGALGGSPAGRSGLPAPFLVAGRLIPAAATRPSSV